MTKKNLIITIILLTVIDLVAAGWYMSRRIEASGKSQNLFEQRDSTEVIAMADTVTSSSQEDVFDDVRHHAYYFIANSPVVEGDDTSRPTSIKHVKTRWPQRINGDKELPELNKELISKAFGNAKSSLKEARYVYLNTPTFNQPVGDEYRQLDHAPKTVPNYGNVSQVLVYPCMTSSRLLVMEVDKVEYNGKTTTEGSTFIHYDRMGQHVLSRIDIITADFEKENKLLKVINNKIDDINKSLGDNKLQHALNVPAEVCCVKNGIKFLYKQGSLSSRPIEILINYDKLQPFLTKSFLDLLKNNEGYKTFDHDVKPESINATTTQPTVKTAIEPVKKTSRQKSSYSGNYYGKKKVAKPKQTKRKRYSGAKRKSGHRGHAGWRH